MPKISPIDRNQDGISVRRREKEMQAAISLPLSKDSDRLAFKRMARPENSYLIWQGVMVGSLSINRLIGSITTSSSPAFRSGSATPALSGWSGPI